ncbi:MAG: tyrosine-protein phosphatase [Lachnospiraceae bacterium]|nr:tyrosine-protein phosphatase [Lachnospiraceae bacterium]
MLHLRPPLCGIFTPNSVNVARYASLIWHKSPAKCETHLTESNFQTRSGVVSAIILKRLGFSNEEIIDDYMESKNNLQDIELCIGCVRYPCEALKRYQKEYDNKCNHSRRMILNGYSIRNIRGNAKRA